MEEKTKQRDSSFELLRIVGMLMIIAHHYIVNSTVLNQITPENTTEFNSVFSYIWGCGGKTAINIFVLISGYFMCRTGSKAKNYVKLVLEMIFYLSIAVTVFQTIGYWNFSAYHWLYIFFPTSSSNDFFSAYLVLFWFIPFINILIKNINEKQHIRFLIIGFVCNSILPTFLSATNAFTYVGHFVFIYMLGAYVRIYPKEIFEKRAIWAIAMPLSLAISWGSIGLNIIRYKNTGTASIYYYVANSNKTLAIVSAFCIFMFFKNLRLKYNPIINKIASTTLGVLFIHANTDAMRKWLWQEVVKVPEAFLQDTWYYLLNAIVSLIVIYLSAVVIDLIRQYLFEKPVLYLYDKSGIDKYLKKLFE